MHHQCVIFNPSHLNTLHPDAISPVSSNAL